VLRLLARLRLLVVGVKVMGLLLGGRAIRRKLCRIIWSRAISIRRCVHGGVPDVWRNIQVVYDRLASMISVGGGRDRMCDSSDRI
jgi:hypothetical protein